MKGERGLGGKGFCLGRWICGVDKLGNQAVYACAYMILDCMHAVRRVSYYGVRKFQECSGE